MRTRDDQNLAGRGYKEPRRRRVAPVTAHLLTHDSETELGDTTPR